ncbi:MAG: hypothetical protein H7Y13_11980 [Sphingobacteriaceae bacterium]|nr:hypothetical protein [Sphingobacteriaceae bacterium]
MKGGSISKIWTPELLEKLIDLYPITPNKDLVAQTGWSIYDIRYYARKFNLKKTSDCLAACLGKTNWTKEKVQFLKDNFHKMTNRQLAKAVGSNLTNLRNKTRQLGLKHYDLEYWTPEQTQFLLDNYRTMGDVVIAEELQKRWPKNKTWTNKHIRTKRRNMKLERTPEEIALIISQYSVPGGRSHTINENTASKNLPDGYVANTIAWRDPELKQEILKHPGLIDIKRKQIQLNRTIKEVRNGR